MLETIAIALLMLWALGLVTLNAGGAIHILLVVGLLLLLIRIVQGKRI